MAEDCVDQAATLARLPDVPCTTRKLRIHGYDPDAAGRGHLSVYGSDAAGVEDLGRPEPLDTALPYTEAEVLWAVRYELARTVEDVLARRTRALFLNARAAMNAAGRVAALMAPELDWDDSRQQREIERFTRVAASYVCS
jgi:glycerol-3-phosphate dehydrogenase